MGDHKMEDEIDFQSTFNSFQGSFDLGKGQKRTFFVKNRFLNKLLEKPLNFYTIICLPQSVTYFFTLSKLFEHSY